MDRPTHPTVSRRRLLAVGGATLTGAAGCLRRASNLDTRPDREQLTLEITTLPSDSDPFAMAIATHLADGLEAAGIDYRLEPNTAETLFETVLFGHDFDIYVARFPWGRPPDPDVLHPLVVSTASAEVGWQNPFGFADQTVDDLLAAQRTRTGEERTETVRELQRQLAGSQPFTPIYRPDIETGVRTDRFSGWSDAVDRLPYGLLALQPVEGDEAGERLRLAATDGRLTTNWNPISAIHHADRSPIELLYDPLFVDDGERRLPWLAAEITWDEEPRAAEVDLRDDLSWHDGESLTAADVAFTYRFLADTSLGAAPSPIPAPRFRGASTLVEDATPLGSDRVRISFAEATRAVAERALTVPILPAHIWESDTETVSVAGIEIDAAITEALITDNAEPVGSGPFRFESAAEDRAVLSRFDDHFLQSTDDDRLGAYRGGPAVEELEIVIAAAHGAAMELLSAGEADATLSLINPATETDFDDEPAIETHNRRSHASYHVGFNTRRSPLSNPNFRQQVARLADKAFLVAEFGGAGEPIASPLAGTDWLAPELEWADDADPETPFLGSDGEVDAEAAREAFREAGFQYSEAGELLVAPS
ncbi:MAG: ABC transporter substrate-binding protein [Halohasta sp.]